MKIQPVNRRLGVLLSGRGSNFEAIADHIASGRLNAEIGLVISNVDSAPGFEKARARGLPAVYVPSRNRPREEFDSEMAGLLKAHDVSLIVLAGFMRIIGPAFIEIFPHRILNIHPSLLPSFPGLQAQRQALEHGVQFSGCTVHIVDDALDGGTIVRQAAVPVLNDDTVETLSARILDEEHRIYSEAIALMLSGRCEIHGRRLIST